MKRFDILATIERVDGTVTQDLIDYNNPSAIYNFGIISRQELIKGGRILTERVVEGSPKPLIKKEVSNRMDQLTMGLGE